MSDTEPTMSVLAIPLLKYGNPLDAFEPEDVEKLEAAIPVVDKMIGAIAAHETCKRDECGVYDEELIEKCLFVRERLDDIALAVREYRNVPRPDAELTNEARAVKFAEASIREVAKKLNIPDEQAEETIQKINVAAQVAAAKAAAMAEPPRQPSRAFVPRHSGKMDA